jgi:hypothetical protein
MILISDRLLEMVDLLALETVDQRPAECRALVPQDRGSRSGRAVKREYFERTVLPWQWARHWAGYCAW